MIMYTIHDYFTFIAFQYMARMFQIIEKQDTYFVWHHSDSQYKYSETEITGMLGFF
jgi:hypothetical protein